jgi:hypothetical protein
MTNKHATKKLTPMENIIYNSDKNDDPLPLSIKSRVGSTKSIIKKLEI